MVKRTVVIQDLAGKTSEMLTQHIMNPGEFAAVVVPAVVIEAQRAAQSQPGAVTAVLDGDSLPLVDDLEAGLKRVEAHLKRPETWAALTAAGVTSLKVETTMSPGIRNNFEFLRRQAQLLLQTEPPGPLSPPARSAGLAGCGRTAARASAPPAPGRRRRRDRLGLAAAHQGPMHPVRHLAPRGRGRRQVSPVWPRGDGLMKSVLGKIDHWDATLQRGRVVSAEGLYHFRSGDFHPDLVPAPGVEVEFVAVVTHRSRAAKLVRPLGPRPGV